MSDSRSSSSVPRAGGWLARQVWQIVNAAERRICGAGAVRSAAVAEGLAWAGHRAARRIDLWRGGVAPAAAVPWVDHRVRREHGVAGYAVELMAGGGQEAVDHCLVAHRIAAQLARPVVCTLDPILAAVTELVRLPEMDAITELPAVRSGAGAECDAEALLALAREAFAEVSEQTGRRLEAATRFGARQARFVLLGAGSDAALARRLATTLESEGLPCAALDVAMLHPFPTAWLREQLQGVTAVAVLSGAGAEVARILAGQATAAVDDSVRVDVIAASQGDDLRLQLSRLFVRDIPELEPDEPESSFAIGGLPAAEKIESLLLDSVAWLGRLCTPALESQGSSGAGPITITVGGPHREGQPIDMLFVAGCDALCGVEPLERIRECGTLLLDGATADARQVWARLSPDQRATIVRRRLRWCLVAPGLTEGTELQGAILAATAGIGLTLGSEAAILEVFKTSDLDDADQAALRRGSEALVQVDASRLTMEEPRESVAPAEPRPPRLPSTETGGEHAELGRELRHFHLQGREGVAEPMANTLTSLRPALLDVLRSDHTEVETPFEAWAVRVLADRRRRRAELLSEVAQLETRLQEMLGLPTTETESADSGLAARLGEVGAEFVDSRALGQRLFQPRPATLSPERSERLSAALKQLANLRRRCANAPVAHVIRPHPHRPVDSLEGVRLWAHEDALHAAIGLFDGLAQEAVDFARALRVARLEVGGRFDDAVHGPALARLDWRSLTAEELFRLPVVLVLETARHLRGPALAAFSELIRSGRPIHVLIEERIGDLARPAAGYDPGLGYLAVAHREALVIQSSAGRPGHLATGLERAVEARDPTVVIVAVPSPELPAASRTQLEAALAGRATPCFVYDPAGGTTWVERFGLADNPQPERPWPVHTIEYEDADGGRTALDLPFTFADVAALDPAWRSHFRPISPEAWLEDQIEIADYLELTPQARSRHIPYLWIVDNGELRRAVVSWELAFACRDRARAWRILQELAGTDNAYVRRAADEARSAEREAAERRIETLEADFAIALESARGEGATAAVGRLVELLADPQGLPAAVATARAAASGGILPALTPAPAARAAAPQIAPQVEEPASAPPAEPYIDSFLCTTCNDCTNLNPRLFRYNANKQAEIGDAAQGTYRELVKAAEVCPARCIHPGSPRPGDKTATPAIVKRAAKFQ